MKCRCRKLHGYVDLKKEEKFDFKCGCEFVRKQSCDLRLDFTPEIKCERKIKHICC